MIGSTTTETGLKVCCEIDGNLYPKGVKVSDQEMAELNIKGNAFHPEWKLHHLAQSTTTLKQLFPLSS